MESVCRHLAEGCGVLRRHLKDRGVRRTEGCLLLKHLSVLFARRDELGDSLVVRVTCELRAAHGTCMCVDEGARLCL